MPQPPLFHQSKLAHARCAGAWALPLFSPLSRPCSFVVTAYCSPVPWEMSQAPETQERARSVVSIRIREEDTRSREETTRVREVESSASEEGAPARTYKRLVVCCDG